MKNDLADKKDLIKKFLGTFKNHAQKRLITIPDREKNLKTLEEMGLSKRPPAKQVAFIKTKKTYGHSPLCGDNLGANQ